MSAESSILLLKGLFETERYDTGSCIGLEAREVLKKISILHKHKQQTISLGWRSKLINEIEELRFEYSKEGWDGYDALPVNKESVRAAVLFAEGLPEKIYTPELAPENSGNLVYDWFPKKKLQFSVSVYPDKLIYAGIIGSEKRHGEMPFIGEIPDEIIKILTDYFSRMD